MQSSITRPGERLQTVRLCTSDSGGQPRVVDRRWVAALNVFEYVPEPKSCDYIHSLVISSLFTMGPGCLRRGPLVTELMGFGTPPTSLL